jgi:nicotinamidase-related amidase
VQGELQVHKPGKGAFWATALHETLQGRGITHLLFAGVTTEVCVQTSMREANDRGYECLLVSDATGEPSSDCTRIGSPCAWLDAPCNVWQGPQTEPAVCLGHAC